MTHVIARANLENRGATPIVVMSLSEWNDIQARAKFQSIANPWELVAETDTEEEAYSLARLLPKRNEEWINDKK